MELFTQRLHPARRGRAPKPTGQSETEEMIIKNLWRRKTRTLLTLLGIAVGVGAVVSLTAFGEGLASGMQLTFSAPEADLTVGSAMP